MKKRWYVKLILVGVVVVVFVVVVVVVVVLVVLELCGILLERTHKIMVEAGKE